MSSQEKRPLTADDLYRIQLVADPQISPDGSQIVFGLSRVDEKTEKKYTNLWLVPGDGSAPPHPFTSGDQTDSRPRWSPDGSQIAFLSNRKDEKQAQLYIIPTDGGEGRPLTDLKGTIGDYQWSPDGSQLVLQFRQKDEETLAREEDEAKKKLGVVARHITRLDYKSDGAGYLPGERWHLWTVDAETGEATQLTEGDKFDETEPRWSPDGRFIYFISNRDEQPDMNWDETEIYRVPAEGGEMEEIPTRPGRKMQLSISPDGRRLAFLGRVKKGKWYQNSRLYIAPAEGGATQDLSGETDLHLSLATLTDVGGGTPAPPPTWSPDGETIYLPATARGNQPLLAFAAGGSGSRTVIDVPGGVGGFSLDAAGETAAYLWGELFLPGQVWSLTLPEGERRALTDFNREWLDEIAFGDIEEAPFTGPDGDRLDGWILTPPDFDPEQTYPSILEIHGGPQTQYGRFFMHEFHFLAAQGYVVYWCNPRGSQGYGEDFAAAIYNRWGTVDYADLMAWVDEAAKRPYIDRDRMGVTGGSYGGYMTIFIIGHTDRFQAAAAQRVVSNLISFYGSSDLHHGAEFLMGTEQPPWEDLENYWRMSPIAHIGNAATPTLVIQSEQDLRCPQEQGEQVFVALKRLGVETELVLFPEEPHGLSRVGRTDRRVQRLEHIARWFERYLKD